MSSLNIRFRVASAGAASQGNSIVQGHGRWADGPASGGARRWQPVPSFA